jgi:hypothetical protein
MNLKFEIPQAGATGRAVFHRNIISRGMTVLILDFESFSIWSISKRATGNRQQATGNFGF